MLAILFEFAGLLSALLLVAVELTGLLPALLLLVAIAGLRLSLVAFVVHCVPHDIG
jgi:hypothetical protein